MPVQKVEGVDKLGGVEPSDMLRKLAKPRQVKEKLPTGTVLQHNEQLLLGLACSMDDAAKAGSYKDQKLVRPKVMVGGGAVDTYLII